jgi:hypothetical protein
MQMKDHHYYRLGHGLQLSEFTPLRLHLADVYRRFCAAAITIFLTLSNVQWRIRPGKRICTSS